MDNPFRAVKTHWIEKINLAAEHKRKHFQKDADELMRFYNGPYEFMYGLNYRKGSASFVFTGEEDMPRPSFCMTVNKAAEMVQLFGPSLYHRNPNRQVNPRVVPIVPPDFFGDPNDPAVQQMYMPILQQVQQSRSHDEARAVLLEHYLNYTPTALDLKTEARNMIDEALIKGMGVLWHDLYTPKGGQFKIVGSFYDTVDRLMIDPDAETLAEAKWVARQCVHPVWQVEDEYGRPRGSLKGNLESSSQQAVVPNLEDDYNRKRGLTNDLLSYWKVYSKMGMGGRLSGMPKDTTSEDDGMELEMFGDYCYLVVCETLEEPINLPSQDAMGNDVWSNPEDIAQRLEWPTPFWADDTWPFTPLAFHWVPRQIWPMSHLKPAMGELKFINWAYSFLAGKIRTASRDLIAVQKSASEELKRALVHGTDYELIEIEKAHGKITEVVQMLQHPAFQGDIYKVIEAVEHNFEKRTGLTELMYGSTSHQYRSAEEAHVKQNQMTIRPDDMANKVEDTMAEVARKEAFMARWHLEPQDVEPVLGPVGAYWWQQLITSKDPTEILHQIEYRIEAGSAKKPNKDRDSANVNQAMQTLFQPLMQLAMAGNPGPVNALITAWAKAIDLDASKFLIQPPPPPPQPGPPPPAGGPPRGSGGPPR